MLWAVLIPDWPVHQYSTPAVVVEKGKVTVANTPARAAGITKGLKLSRAQALCPELTQVDFAAGQQINLFAPLLQDLHELAPEVMMVRPGLAVLRGCLQPELIADVLLEHNCETFLGAGPHVAAAILAANVSAVWEEEDLAAALSEMPLTVFLAEAIFSVTPEIIAEFAAVGIVKCGQLAALPRGAVVTRFGSAGEQLWQLAAGQDQIPFSATAAPQIRQVRWQAADPDQYAYTAEQVAYLMQRLIERLFEQLPDYEQPTQVVLILAAAQRQLQRKWRCPKTAETKKWATTVGTLLASELGQPVQEISIRSLAAPQLQPGLFALPGQNHDFSELAAALPQVNLQVPCDTGMRQISKRIQWLPYGAEKTAQPAWLGCIPPPYPARLLELAVQVLDQYERQVQVAFPGILSAVPKKLCGKISELIDTVYGPWPLDQTRYYIQAVTGNTAFLLRFDRGSWVAEAAYA